MCMCVFFILPKPFKRAKYDTMLIFEKSTAGLNIVFLFQDRLAYNG